MYDETRTCLACGETKPITQFGKHYNGGQTYETRRKICEKCKKNRLYYKYRLLFLKHFEYKCQCCDVTDVRFLTLDHVQNDGFKDEHMSPVQVYRKAWEEKFDKTKWSCLCWNCNCGRSQFKGICPHKLVETNLQYIDRLKIMAGDLNSVNPDNILQHLVNKMSKEDMLEFIGQLEKAVPRPTE